MHVDDKVNDVRTGRTSFYTDDLKLYCTSFTVVEWDAIKKDSICMKKS